MRELDIQHVRQNIGIVLQDNFLFRGTVRENIAMAKPNCSFQEIVYVARMAGASEFIERMPQSYDTLLEENGSNLSGGQKQRLAIARALLKDPRILIFDEATSALDPESEAIIQKNLKVIANGRTVIIVSHRLSTLTGCDAIIVLENGEIAAMGPHKKLLESCKDVPGTMVSTNGTDLKESVKEQRFQQRKLARLEAFQDRQQHDRILNEFQPDAVEIEKGSVPGGARWTLYTVIVLLAAGIAWSCWAQVDEIVVGEGKLITTIPPILVDTKLASPIRSINIKFGDTVKAGQVIATLDPTFSESDVENLEAKKNLMLALQARLARKTMAKNSAWTGINRTSIGSFNTNSMCSKTTNIRPSCASLPPNGANSKSNKPTMNRKSSFYSRI